MPLNNKSKKKPELLAPAGDWISLQAAIQSKADAIYFGISGFNMREGTSNFNLSELKKIASLCHKNNIKCYLALNTIIYQQELPKIKKLISAAKISGVDAIICWDLSVIAECARCKMPIHLSTQASVSNFLSASMYASKFNVKRVVLARECTLDDVKKIKKQILTSGLDIQIETFVHGAMCVSVSGRCFMSQFLFNKSANRGECIQPCRRSYIVRDPEEQKELELGNHYVMSPKDLCTLPFLDQLIDGGIDCFKIEGRNRSPEYVGATVSAYREFIDFYLSKPKPSKEAIKEKKLELMDKLSTVYNRGFSSGFFMGRPIEEWTDDYGSKAIEKKSYVGKVLNYFAKAGAAEILVESGILKLDDKIMLQGSTTGVFEQMLESMYLDKNPIAVAKRGDRITILIKDKVRKNDRLYVIKKA